MALRRMVALASVVAAVAGVGLAGPASATESDSLHWTPCTQLAPSWPKDGGTKAECTTVTVPVDYARPDGRSISLAVDRIPASDPAHRRGVLVLNPGGPGGPGMSLPEEVRTSRLGELGRYYDLVGFDPRGTGFSAQVDCQAFGGEPEPKPGASEKDTALARIRWRGDRFRDCAAKDPELAGSLGVTTIARDLDRIREALGEQKIDYFGISWGTALGAAYRSLFDGHVGRMALDSVLPPDMNLDKFEADETKAWHDNALRFAGWMAERDSVLHLGTTADQVYANELALRDELKARPRKVVVDGQTIELNDTWVENQVGSSSIDWGYAASALAAARAGKNPPARPPQPNAAPALGWDEKRPYGLNRFVQHAVNCADATGSRDLDRVWNDFSALGKQYPLATAGEPIYAGSCVDWPYAGKNFDYRRGSSELQLIGHQYETNTPYAAAGEMQQRIGGTVLTVQDDMHGSLLMLPCASKVAQFFETGKPATGSCPGEPSPEPSAP